MCSWKDREVGKFSSKLESSSRSWKIGLSWKYFLKLDFLFNCSFFNFKWIFPTSMKTFQLKKTKTNLNLSIYSIFKTAFTNYTNLIPITRWSFDNVMISMRSSDVDLDGERVRVIIKDPDCPMLSHAHA